MVHRRPARSTLTFVLAAALAAGAGGPGPAIFAEDAKLKAGAAKVDITPTAPVVLAGYAFRTEPSRGVHDPLSARAVAFERDGSRIVLVSTDLIGFYGGTAEPLRKAILEGCGLKPEELFLSAIHTHSAPSLTLDETKGNPANVAYTKALREKLVDVVRSALGRMEPVRVSVASGSSPVGANRREVVRGESGEARIVLGRNPEVLTDREVQVLKVARASDGAPIAVLFAYATHSTSLGPGNYLVTGDVHGLAEQFVEAHLEGGVIAPGFAGASGDIDPWFRVLPGFKDSRGWIPEPILLGTMLGEEVVATLEKAREVASDGPIRSVLATLELPGKPTGAGAEPPKVPLAITVARVGKIGFVGLGCEAFDEIGRAIKAASPFSPTFVITHCNGAAGYLAPERCYPEGGYEIETSKFAPAAAGIVIAEATRMLAELSAETSRSREPVGRRRAPSELGPRVVACEHFAFLRPSLEGGLGGPALEALKSWDGEAAGTFGPSGEYYQADPNNSIIFRIERDRARILAGDGARGFRDGPAEGARFDFGVGSYSDTGIACDAEGNVYVAEALAGRLRKIYRRPDGTWWVTTIAGGGSRMPRKGEAIPAREMKVGCASRFALEPDGTVYFATHGGVYRIRGGMGELVAEARDLQRDLGERAAIADWHCGGSHIAPQGIFYWMPGGGPDIFRLDVQAGKAERYAGIGRTAAGLDGESLLESGFHTVLAVYDRDASTIYTCGGDENVPRRIADGRVASLRRDGAFRPFRPGEAARADDRWREMAAVQCLDSEGRLYLFTGDYGWGGWVVRFIFEEKE